MMAQAVPASWRTALEPVLASAEARRLADFLRAEEAAGRTIYPPKGARLRALDLTLLDEVKVVLLGQDPYHGPGQAHGLCFSVPPGVRKPPSLVNVFKELHADLGPEFVLAPPDHGNLEGWAAQGVLLLNTVLTVEAGQAGSHQGQGWEAITNAVVAAVAARAGPCVFILWGSHAQKKARAIAGLVNGPHLLLQSAHPSPLSAYRGFFGSRPFSQTNAFLQSQGRGAIDWRL